MVDLYTFNPTFITMSLFFTSVQLAFQFFNKILNEMFIELKIQLEKRL